MISPIAITGATGFIGRRTVEAARVAGLELRVFARRPETVPAHWRQDAGIDITILDLASTENLADYLDGVQSVIHCAAAMAGDHENDTLEATQTLIEAVVKAEVPHVVLAGSISVYDATTLADGATLDEACKIGVKGRDAYAAAKYEQEDMLHAAAVLHKFSLTKLRLGAVWGPTRLFNAHIGPAFGPVLLRLDGGGTVPLCDVELAAECLVKASQAANGVEALNVVDDALPTRAQFLRAFRASGWPKLVFPLPLAMMRLLAAITPETPEMPGLLRRPILEARHKPLTYSNHLMHKRLGPVTNLPFETAMRNSIKNEQTQ
ncbi:NAD-dependent epimerase/dehydratase family protein [Shimia haliotis]|uniref:NAD dependent epimerase/dehydratase family protein n=1 Tax=Shimia haliotis TaxID=1280847 RepID=A0A1I4GG93_9RHOB|nr:NAD(P)-dependent oxidoreductase [Shimia haliotis]SFL28530.1 NAD dependent epimerase/dehydratase family protein [Shimia haliotis]